MYDDDQLTGDQLTVLQMLSHDDHDVSWSKNNL